MTAVALWRPQLRAAALSALRREWREVRADAAGAMSALRSS